MTVIIEGSKSFLSIDEILTLAVDNYSYVCYSYCCKLAMSVVYIVFSFYIYCTYLRTYLVVPHETFRYYVLCYVPMHMVYSYSINGYVYVYRKYIIAQNLMNRGQQNLTSKF